MRSRPNTNHVDFMICDTKLSIHSLYFKTRTRRGWVDRFGPKVGQIDPNMELIQIRFQYILAQYVLKSELKNPEFVPFGDNLTHF